jgi:hypothetical protein
MSLTKVSYSMIEAAPVNVKDLGAVGDGVTNDTVAFQKASAAINAAGSGRMVIPPGEYIVGAQTLAGAFGLGYAYKAETIITIENCTGSVEIIGYGAKLKIADGLKYGAFNPVTGAPYASTAPFYDTDYFAEVGRVISIEDNTGRVSVKGLEIDGNISNLSLGGPAGDVDIQLAAYGIIGIDNKAISLEDIYTHDNGLDGVYANSPSGFGYNDEATLFLMTNVISEYNARQGLSYTGGKGLTAINCKFNNTGKGAFATAPSSGIDLEGEGGGFAVSGTFINCEVANNKAAALLAIVNYVDVSFYRCSFYGTTDAFALYIFDPGVRFYDCYIVGSNSIAGSTPDQANRVFFRNCNFNSAGQWKNISSQWPAQPLIGSSTGNPIFESCVFSTAGTTVPLNFSTNATTYRNCTLVQNTYSSTSFPRGTYEGSNLINCETGSLDLFQAIFAGSVKLTGAGTFLAVPEGVSSLPAANSVAEGTRLFVVDATVTTFASIVVGGGANAVPVYSDGTNWRIG